ncbi:MAG: NosD domain-containing protein [Candidatus Bathyarchaeia archaeon]|jgi:parallel beta-helix repeat protein
MKTKTVSLVLTLLLSIITVYALTGESENMTWNPGDRITAARLNAMMASVVALGDTVSAETVYGVTSNAGSSLTASKSDHTHGTPNAKFAAEYTVYKVSTTCYAITKDGTVTSNADAATLINACITALSTGGGSIHVLDGSYVLTAEISLTNKVNIILDKHVIFTLGFDGIMFDLNSVYDASIKGGYLYGNKTVYSGTPIRIAGTSYRNTVADCYIYSFDGPGIQVNSALASHNTIINNVVEDVTQEGIMVALGFDNTIICNTVKTTGYHGILVTGGDTNNITKNVVLFAGGNYIAGFAHGIAVDGSAGTQECFGNRVEGNIVISSFMAGIEIADSAHRTSIIGNYVHTTGVGNTVDKYGIYVGGSYAPSNDCIVMGNQVYNATYDRGILIAGTATDNRTLKTIVIGNVVQDSGIDGIYLKWVDDSIVEGNVCWTNAAYGCAFEDANADYNIILGNNFRNNTSGGYSQNGANTNGIQEHNLT